MDIALGPMNRDELRETIERPAKALEVKIEDGLTDRILDTVGDEPGNLPFLEFALTELWKRQTNSPFQKGGQGGFLTHAAYDEIGGVEQALASYAEGVYTTLTADEQNRAQRIFIQLVRPGEGTEDTRRVATRADVGEENWELVSKLADARLVVTGGTQETGDTVEVVHEALIQRWQRLQEWMNAEREFRMWQERLRMIMPITKANTYEEADLLKGTMLVTAEEWFQKNHDKLNQYEQQFIEASLQLRDKEFAEKEARQHREIILQKRSINRLRWLIITLVLLLAILIFPSTYSEILRFLVKIDSPLVYIQASHVIIGSDSAIVSGDEKPEWKTNISAFEIEQYEVTNHQYQRCVQANVCSPPSDEQLYKQPERMNHPIVYVNALQAKIYCHWLGRRLPTELEWERVARGSNGREWPWGNESPDPMHLNIHFDNVSGIGTKSVGSYPKGATPEPEQVFDILGNVWEWTASSYHLYPYNPQTIEMLHNDFDQYPAQLIIRGGGWRSTVNAVRPTIRVPAIPLIQDEDIGFRCAR